MSGNRYNEGKPRFSLMSPWALEGLAKVFTFGAVKYTKWKECDCGGKKLPPGNRECTPTCASRTKLYAGEWNWAKGLSWLETVDSLNRHLNAFLQGEEIDPDSRLPHIDHVQWNAHVLSHFQKMEGDARGRDDRWLRQAQQEPQAMQEPQPPWNDGVVRAPVSTLMHHGQQSRGSPAILACGAKGGLWNSEWPTVTCPDCLKVGARG